MPLLEAKRGVAGVIRKAYFSPKLIGSQNSRYLLHSNRNVRHLSSTRRMKNIRRHTVRECFSNPNKMSGKCVCFPKSEERITICRKRKWHSGCSIISKPLILLVPGAGIEPAQPQGPRDFKSLLWHITYFHFNSHIFMITIDIKDT